MRRVTKLPVFGLNTISGRPNVEEVFAWTTWDTLIAATGFRLDRGTLEDVPIVIRRLEFVPASDRLPLLAEVIAHEVAAVQVPTEARSQ